MNDEIMNIENFAKKKLKTITFWSIEKVVERIYKYMLDDMISFSKVK